MSMETALDVEKDGLAFALEIDVEDIHDLAPPLLTSRDQRLASGWLLDDVEHRIGGVEIALVGEIHPRRQADIDAARSEPKIDVRRHRLVAVPAGDGSGLDGVERENACREVGSGPAPTPKGWIDGLVLLPVGGVIVSPGRVGLPDLDQD